MAEPKRRSVIAVVVVSAVGAWCALGFGGGVPSASAKIEPPPITLPPLPPAATQPLGLVGPVVNAECGTIINFMTLLVPAFGGSLPIDPVPLLAGLVQACGLVPETGTALKCGTDATVSTTLGQVLGSLKILLALVNVSVAAPVAEEVGVVTAAVPASLGLKDVATMIASALQCSAASQTAGGAPGTGLAPATTIPTLVTLPPSSPPPPSGSSSAPAAIAPSSAPPVNVTATGPSVSSSLPPAPAPLAAGALVAVTTPGGGTPVGSALIGFLLLVIVAGAVALGLRREAQLPPGER